MIRVVSVTWPLYCSVQKGADNFPRFFFFFSWACLLRVAFRDEDRDRSIAKHVMSVHINASGVNAGAQEGDIDIATMKKFVSYCRLKCAPRLSEAAAKMLSSQVGHRRLADAVYKMAMDQ